jgi:transcriptional regulator with XRE-family HTH domain
MLGPFLRGLRQRARIRVAEVVTALEVPRPTLYLWEGPRSRPDPVALRRLCEFYGAAETEIAEALRLRSLTDHDPSLNEASAATA